MRELSSQEKIGIMRLVIDVLCPNGKVIKKDVNSILDVIKYRSAHLGLNQQESDTNITIAEAIAIVRPMSFDKKIWVTAYMAKAIIINDSINPMRQERMNWLIGECDLPQLGGVHTREISF